MRSARLFVTMTLGAAMAVTPVAARDDDRQAAAPVAPALSAPMASLRGVWMLTHIDGLVLEGSGQELLITITADTFVGTINGQVIERGTFTIDGTKSPWTIDIESTAGDAASLAQRGIMQLTKNRIVATLSRPGVLTRPTDFEQSGTLTFTAVKQ